MACHLPARSLDTLVKFEQELSADSCTRHAMFGFSPGKSLRQQLLSGTGKRINQQIHPKLQGCICYLLWVVVLIIGPAVGWIGFVRVKCNHSSLIKKPECLGRLIVMFMNFGRAPVWKIVDVGINRVVGREFNKVLIRENPRQVRPYILVETVIVIYIQKTARFEVSAQVFHFRLLNGDIPVAGNEQKRVVENIAASKLNIIIPLAHTDGNLLFRKTEHVCQCRGRAVPVAAATILNPRYFKLIIILCFCSGCDDKREQEESG